MTIEAHDPHHLPEADLRDKGLSHNAVGLIGGTVLGISSVAPAYALTATIGILVAEAGTKMPVVIIAGFLPMFFAAYAYRELNKGGARLRYVVHLDDQGVRTVRGVARWVGRRSRHRDRAVEPGRRCGPVLLPVPRRSAEQPRPRGAVGEQAGQRPDLPGLSRRRHVGRVPRHHHHGEGPVRARGIPTGPAADLRAGRTRQGRRLRDRTRLQPRLVQPVRLDPLRIRGRPVRVDLRLLGMGHEPDGQRGVQGVGEDPWPRGCSAWCRSC